MAMEIDCFGIGYLPIWCVDIKYHRIAKQSRAEKLRLLIRHVHLFVTVGSSFSESTLGPLKSTLIRELKIDNAQVSAHERLRIAFKGVNS